MKRIGGMVGVGIVLATLMLAGIAGSIWAGNKLDGAAKSEWLKKFRIDAARLTDGVLFWSSKTKVNLRAIASQVKAVGISDQDAFLKLIDDAASWDPDVTFDSVAFAPRVMRPERQDFEARHGAALISISAPGETAPPVFMSFGVTMSSVGDGFLKPMNDLTTHAALKTTVASAFRLPGDVILGPTYSAENGHKMVLIATQAETVEGKGVMVAELDISEFFSIFSSDNLPKGLKLRLIERDSEARSENAFHPVIGNMTADRDVLETEVLRVVSGQARWDLNWDITAEYLGGPSNFSAVLVQVGGTLLSILLFGTIGYLAFQNIRFHAQVAERTAALSQNSMIVQLTMDSIDQGFAVWNADQRLVVWSRRCYDFWLEPPKSVLRTGMHMRDLLLHLADAGAFGADANATTVDAEMDRIFAAGQASEDQFDLPNGRNVHVRRFPLEHGGYVAVYSDVTEQEEATRSLNLVNQDLEIQKKMADDASRVKTEFLATMSHEIRTPMTVVMGYADLLLEEDLPADSKNMVTKIKDSSRSLLVIINDILDVSKLEAGKLEIEYLDFHLPAMIQGVMAMFGGKKLGNRRNEVALSLSVSDDFPTAAHSDPTRLRQILVNLIGNALKFTDEGDVKVEVSLERVGKNGPRLMFRVHDTGIGLAPETVSKLFTDFTQADASITRRFEGSGLGLAICKRLVGLMDGEIGVESELGVGSNFWFAVPFVAATAVVDDGSPLPSPQSGPVATARALKILVAEDNEVNQAVIAQTLTAFGHEFVFAGNGIQAVAALEGDSFDIILMDVRMPEMSGTDATRMIRRMDGRKGDIPIVALTADVMAEHKVEYIDAGMNAVATKPIDRGELTAAINAAMGEIIHPLT